MERLKIENPVNIFENTLDCVDKRLTHHGKRVAYLIYRVIKKQNKYTDKMIRDICFLALLHDIGAFKTEELNRLVEFETVNVWEHSIYGYLFLKYFSPLEYLAPAIYFHHAACNELNCIKPEHRELAQIISLCDRADIFNNFKGKNTGDFIKYVKKMEGDKFFPETIDAFIQSGVTFNDLDNMDSDEGFIDELYNMSITEREVAEYIKTLILSIEFRSRQTAVHTISCTSVAGALARLLNRGDDKTVNIITGAMLHDIGKTGTPLNILEFPGKLNDDAMKIMKEHVTISEQIIKGNVSDEILKIAVRHHEKLNGEGYPRGLKGKDLTTDERILAVADVFSALSGTRSYKDSYSKEKTVRILKGMAESGHIDNEIAEAATDNFGLIINEHVKHTQPLIKMYNKINDEYNHALNSIDDLKEGKLCL